MQAPVYRVVQLLCAVVGACPIGTNLGLLHLMWMLVTGKLLLSRGAVFPGLSASGLSEGAVRRAWAALGTGSWTSHRLVKQWARVVEAEGFWQPHLHGGYHPVAVDVTAFWRPRLQGCPTRHYSAEAGKALPAIVVGIITRVGSVGGQRFGLPLGLVRADPADPSPRTYQQALLKRAVDLQRSDDLLVTDREFTVGRMQAAGATVWVTRLLKNVTARRAEPRPYQGRGRPPKYGDLVRPLTGAPSHPARPGERLERGGTRVARRAVDRTGLARRGARPSDVQDRGDLRSGLRRALVAGHSP